MKSLFTYIILIVILSASCRRESFIKDPGALLAVSSDSIPFDTMFTATGSVTRSFKIFNRNNKKLLISRIAVAGNTGSSFRINADGFSGPEVNNLEMEANDSLYVFVSAYINPNAENLPFIIEDSISIEYNGNRNFVKLSAWGQNAEFLKSAVIDKNTTWTDERPYVILGALTVAEGITLTIEKGARIHLHNYAPFLVDGTIQALGEYHDSTRIIFQGDRLDKNYKDLPGAWPGIYLSAKSRNSVFNYTTIRNAYQGIVTEGRSATSSAKLELNGCIIDNCFDAGILASGSDIRAVNCLVSNCGKNMVLANGGYYRFLHCTNVAVSNTLIQHRDPVLFLSDNISKDGSMQTGELDALFENCIFWGVNGIAENEVAVSREGTLPFEAVFRNCLWKNITAPENVTLSGMIENEEPLFASVNAAEGLYDFRLSEYSPARDAGISAGITTDIEGAARENDQPDIGAYEYPF